MRGGLPRLACLLGTLAALCWAAPASAAQPRIINGDAASTGEYPAQGYLRLRVDGDTFSCGGTLLTPTKFVTAAHCATDGNGAPLAPSAFSVRLGSNDRDSGGTLHDVAGNEVHEDYDAATFDNDVAVLTLATASSLTPLGLIRTDQTALWEPDDVAWVVGWGTTSNAPGDPGSDLLREADVPIRSDASCRDLLAYGADFHPATMVCAGGGGTMSDSDTCAGDSGGPLLVPDVPPFVLAGITSWGDLTCNHPTRPGVYTRLGAPALNAWVRGRRAGLDFSVTPSTPTAGQPARLTAISQGASGYTWDLDGDQVFDDARGASVSHTFPSAGQRRVGVRAADAEAQPAETRRIVSVAAATASPGPTATPGPAPVPAPPAPAVTPVPLPRTPLATILAARRPKVVRGRFSIRIRYSTAAPTGIATVEVFRARRKIGTARIRVARGTTRRASVKLNKAGRRLLRRSNRKKLRVTVKVRVGRTQLASRRLTIRR